MPTCHLLRQVKKTEQAYRSTQCLAHLMSLLSFFATFVLSLTECVPPTFLEPPKTYQTTLGRLLAAYAEL